MKFGIVLALAALMVAAPPALAGDPTGIWMMANGKVTVRVAACGDKLCGRIVALKKPRDKKGRPKLDRENPNQALRRRPLMGLSLLQNMRPAGADRWQGAIYNPDDGRTYRATMRLTGTRTLQVQGCVAVFCKSQRFVKVN